MARNLTNTNSVTNVYLNRDAIEADLPVQALQPSTSDPITISLKGLPTSFSGYADKVIKVKSDESGLEYATDSDTTLWIESGSNVYPKNVGQVLINTTANTNSRNLLINGTVDVVGNLHFGNNNDIYIKSQGQNMRNYVGYNSGTGASHLFYVKQSTGTATEVGSIKTGSITNIGNANISSGNSQLNLYSASNQSVEIKNNDGGGVGGSPYLSFECQNDNSGAGTSDYYVKWVLEGSERMRLSTTGLSNVSWKGSTISEIYGGTNQTSYSTGDILYASASNTLSKLSIGSTDQVLTVIGGVPSWEDAAAPDLTTSTNFATAVQSGTIKMGNSSGNSYTSNLELYFNSTLKLMNTSNIEVAKFTVSSNTANLTLNGGIMTTATFSTNCVWNGGTIGIAYGGTNLSSLTANKILQVNSSANGYNLVDLPNSSLWTSSAGTLSVLSSYTKLDLDTNITYNLLNTDVRVKPTSLSEGQLISYDSGLGGGNGSMIFGTNSTSASSGWDTGIYAKQFIKFKCASTDIAEFSVSPASVKTIKLLGDVDNLSVKSTGGDTVVDYIVNSFSDDIVFNIREPNAPQQFKIRTNPYDPVYEMTHISSISVITPVFKYYSPGGTRTLNVSPIVKFEGSYLINNSNDVIYWPSSGGTLALNTISARLGSFGTFGCVYDPNNVTTPSASNSALLFATNGTVTRMNCRVDSGGSSSNCGFDFAGNNVFRFDSNGTINVRNSGQSMYAFNTPNTSGTLALIDQVQEKQSYIRLGDQSDGGSNNYGLICDPNYTINYANAVLKYHTNGTDLRLNTRVSSSANIFFDYGNSNVFKFTSGGSIQVGNNKMTSNASYGYQFEGVANRQISIPIGTYYPYIGASSSHPYVLHINGIGDAYRLTGTSTSNLKHEFVYGRVGIGISSPAVPLHIESQSSGGGTFTSGFYARSQAAGSGFASANGYQYWNNDPISIVCEGGGYFKTGYLVASDERIKTNIEDVPDNLALDYLRNIPCRYYEYIDKTRGYDKTIGFIAQEVREVFPLAVSIGEEIVPDIYKNINCIWTEKEDKFIMKSPDLTNVNGIEYLFYGLNEGETEEERIAVVGDEDNSFTFDKKFDTVFCYGSEVKDFNRLSHEKLFTLNFSATQEIDRIQQTHITKIATLEKENETLKNELTLIKELLTKNNIV